MNEKKKIVALVQRHGDTAANEADVYRSRLDPPLNEKGVKQAEKSAAYIKKNFDVYKIVSSPLLRAIETADIIAEEVSKAVEQDRGLMAWNLGFLTGKPKGIYSDLLDYYVDNPEKTIPEGESLDDLEQRTYDFFEPELSKPWEDSIPLFITHSSNIITLDNLLREETNQRQESGEVVGPGGLAAVYDTGEGYEIEDLLGQVKEGEYGS